MDPAVFFDLAKIRRHVDEATSLAVRAASGLTAAALSSLHGHGALGQAAALGMGGGGGGQLSRERKHRMRELATAKLGAAYRLDEIATSVATMQSASTLEDVAQLVLQRSPADVDAKYVHFFHEKIPSRMLAQCTPLDALDDVLADRPSDASALRTRALTRLFKDDHAAAARDLTDALAAARYLRAQHQRDGQLALADAAPPASLETQLLFHRAGVYLTMACAHVAAALDGLQAQEAAAAARDAQRAAGDEPAPETPDELAGRLHRADSRKQLRQNAKRALRDYLAFLAHFDYTPGISPAAAEDFLRRLNPGQAPPVHRLLESASQTTSALPQLDQSLAPFAPADRSTWPTLPTPPVFTLNALFDAVPPAALPPYPPPASPPSPPPPSFAAHESLTYHPLLTDALHSLLLCHALLQTPAKENLRHAHNAARLARICDGYPIFLAARSPARSDWVEVLRRGNNWLGLSHSWDTLCRSPNDTAPSSNSSRSGAPRASSAPETPAQKRERQKHEAILEALADERVVDEESFQRAVRARELRFRDDERQEAARAESCEARLGKMAALTLGPGEGTETNGTTNGSGNANGIAKENPPPTTNTPANNPANTPANIPANPPNTTKPPRWAPDTPPDYPISTARADAIARWVRDAPPLAGESGAPGKKRRKNGGRRGG